MRIKVSIIHCTYHITVVHI